MKITVRNTDGRLGTGVSAIEYTTQKDGGVSKTVKAASPVKKKPATAAPEAKPSVSASGAASSLTKGAEGGAASIPSLQNQLRQAQVDLDTDAIVRLNKQLKEERARQGKLTTGDRVSDVALSALGGSGSSFTNLAGFVSNLFQDPEADRRSIARAQEALRTGRTTDGKPINDAQRKTLQDAVSRLEASAAKKESPDSFTNRAYRAADRMADTGAAYQQSAKEGLGKVGSTIVDAATSMGQSAIDAAIGAATGTGMLPFVARSLGGSTQEARRGGANLSQQLTYGSAQAAKEYVTEKLFGLAAPQRIIGGGSFDDAIEAGIRKATERLAKTPGGQKAVGGLMTWLAGGATEALEEGIGSLIENTLINPNLRDWDPDTRTTQQKFEDGLYDMLVGGVSGLMGVTNLFGYQAGENPQSASRTAPFAKGAKETAREAAQGGAQAVQTVRKGTDTSPTAETVQNASQAVPKDFLMEVAARGGRLEAEPDMQRELERFQLKETAQKAAPETGAAREYHGQILDSVRANLDKVRSMQSVAKLTGNEFQKTAGDSRNLRRKVIDFFNSLGNKVNRPGMGEIELNAAGARDSTAHGYGKLKAATFAALPSVLEHGTLIEHKSPYEGHNYDSYLISAPVDVNGTTCYVGALVIKDSNMQRYKLHEVLTTDENGTPLFKSESSGETAGPLRSDAPFGEPGGSPTVDSTIPQGADSVKPGIMEQEIQRLFGSGKRVSMDGDDGLGAADAGSLNSDYDRLQAQSSQFHPEGANAARPVDVPKKDFDGRNISQSASTVMGARAIPDDVIPMIEQMVAEGRMSYDPVSNAASQARARAKIEEKGFQGALEEYRNAVRAGISSADISALGATLLNNAANAGDGRATAELLSLYQASGTSTAQAMQARRILRKLSPESQLYSIQRSVGEINAASAERNQRRGVRADDADAAHQAVEEALREAERKLETMTAAYENVVDTMRDAYSEAADGGEDTPGWVETLGQELAANAERRARPSRQGTSTVYETMLRDLNTLMAEHVRKPEGARTRRTASDIIANALANRQEYAAAWQTAQAVLLEKYANDPAALEVLKEFNETSPLFGGAGPDTTMMKAVTEAALENDVTVKDLVIRSQYDAEALTNQIADTLIRRTGANTDTDRAVIREAVQRYVRRKTEGTGKYAFEYINSDIGKVMRDIGVRMSEIIKSSPQSKEELLNRITDTLVGEYRVSEEAASAIAKDIAEDFLTTVRERSKKKLEQLFKDRPKRTQRTLTAKFEELVNLGAFSGEEFSQNAVRKLFGLDGDVTISQELIQKFLDQTDQAGRDAVMEEILQNAADQLPGSWRGIFDSMRYLSMLFNPRTHGRNVIGNAVFQIPATLKNRVGALVEKGAKALGSDIERTKSITGANPFGDLAKEARADWANAKEFLEGGHYGEDKLPAGDIKSKKAEAIADVYQYADAMGKMEVSDYRPGKGTVAAGVLKSMLPPASYILYQINKDRDGDDKVSTMESTQTLMELPGLTDEQLGKAWTAFNANKSKTAEIRNPFTGVLTTEGMSPENAQAAWDIYNRSGTEEDPYTQREKKQDLREELNLTTQEVNRLWNLMKRAMKN